jgi:hypothetical protein
MAILRSGSPAPFTSSEVGNVVTYPEAGVSVDWGDLAD